MSMSITFGVLYIWGKNGQTACFRREYGHSLIKKHVCRVVKTGILMDMSGHKKGENRGKNQC
jgi:hypothetical protein